MFHPVFQTRKHPLFVSAESIMKIIDQRLFVINLLHEHSVRKACWPDYDDFVLEVAKFIINNAVEFTDKVLINIIRQVQLPYTSLRNEM